MPSGIPIRKGAGAMRHRVTLQEGVPVEDELGGREMTYPAFGEDWAAIDAIPDVRSETEAVVLFQVTMRYRSDLVTKFETERKQIQVVAAGRTLKVLAIINPEQRSRDLVLHCGQVF